MKIYLVMRQYNSNVKPIRGYKNYIVASMIATEYQEKEPVSYSPCRYYVEEVEIED